VPPERLRGWGWWAEEKPRLNLRFFLLPFINEDLLTFYTRVTYFMEPHLTARQTGIARSSVARFFYSAFRPCYQIGFADQHRPGQQSRSRFRRRGDCDLQAGVVLSRWLVPSSDRDKQKFDRCMARFRDSFVMRNTHDNKHKQKKPYFYESNSLAEKFDNKRILKTLGIHWLKNRDYRITIRFTKFKMADSIWRP